MKSIGQQAKEFRESKGWSFVRMAEEVSKHHGEAVSRQLITQLEEAGDRKPRYLRALALTMGVSSDALLAGQYQPPGPAATSELQTDSQPGGHQAIAIAPGDAIQALALAISGLAPAARENAATLLSSLARDPGGPWGGWLTALIEQEVTVQGRKTDKEGKSPSDSSSPPNTIGNSGDAMYGPALKRAFEAGRGDDESESGGIPKPRSDSNN